MFCCLSDFFRPFRENVFSRILKQIPEVGQILVFEDG